MQSTPRETGRCNENKASDISVGAPKALPKISRIPVAPGNHSQRDNQRGKPAIPGVADVANQPAALCISQAI
jgi:hypothetical protein